MEDEFPGSIQEAGAQILNPNISKSIEVRQTIFRVSGCISACFKTC